MNKSELVEAVANSANLSRSQAETALNGMLRAIEGELKKGNSVQLVGFGAFAVATRAARRGFNPHTKQPMKIRAMKTVRFRAGQTLRDQA